MVIREIGPHGHVARKSTNGLNVAYGTRACGWNRRWPMRYDVSVIGLYILDVVGRPVVRIPGGQ